MKQTERLMGKTISYYDSFSGRSYSFVIERIEVLDDSIRVRPARDHWGVFIEKSDLGELLASGFVIKTSTLEGCTLQEEWFIR